MPQFVLWRGAVPGDAYAPTLSQYRLHAGAGAAVAQADSASPCLTQWRAAAERGVIHERGGQPNAESAEGQTTENKPTIEPLVGARSELEPNKTRTYVVSCLTLAYSPLLYELCALQV